MERSDFSNADRLKSAANRMTETSLRLLMRALLALFISLCASLAIAGEIRTVQDLLRSPTRPTMEDLRRVYPVLPVRNPFKPLAANQRLELVRSTGAEMVADVIFAYPGATFATLGRDADMAADILEAYFLDQGITGRVVRLKASRASFNGRGLEYGFLVSSGVVGKRPSPEDRFVILDSTSYSSTSQSRQLLSAYYQRATSYGLDPAEVMTRVAVIGLNEYKSSNLNRIDRSKPRQIALFEGVEATPTGPSSIHVTVSDFAYVGEVLRDGIKIEIAWTDSFGPFRRGLTGRVHSTRGRVAEAAVRATVLHDMIEIARAVESSDFRANLTRAIRVSAEQKTLREDLRIAATRGLGTGYDAVIASRSWNSKTFSKWVTAERTKTEAARASIVDRRAGELLLRLVEADAISQAEFKDAFISLMDGLTDDPSNIELSRYVLIEAMDHFGKEMDPKPAVDALLAKINRVSEAQGNVGSPVAQRAVIEAENAERALRNEVRKEKWSVPGHKLKQLARNHLPLLLLGGIITGLGARNYIEEMDSRLVPAIVAEQTSEGRDISRKLENQLREAKTGDAYFNALANASYQVDRRIWGTPRAVFFNEAILKTADHFASLAPENWHLSWGRMGAFGQETIFDFANDPQALMALAEGAMAGLRRHSNSLSPTAHPLRAFDEFRVPEEKRDELNRLRSRFIAQNGARLGLGPSRQILGMLNSDADRVTFLEERMQMVATNRMVHFLNDLVMEFTLWAKSQDRPVSSELRDFWKRQLQTHPVALAAREKNELVYVLGQLQFVFPDVRTWAAPRQSERQSSIAPSTSEPTFRLAVPVNATFGPSPQNGGGRSCLRSLVRGEG